MASITELSNFLLDHHDPHGTWSDDPMQEAIANSYNEPEGAILCQAAEIYEIHMWLDLGNQSNCHTRRIPFYWPS